MQFRKDIQQRLNRNISVAFNYSKNVTQKYIFKCYTSLQNNYYFSHPVNLKKSGMCPFRNCIFNWTLNMNSNSIIYCCNKVFEYFIIFNLCESIVETENVVYYMFYYKIIYNIYCI